MSQDPETIAADIEAQREQLAQTLDQIGAKLDVKQRAKEGARRTVDRATDADGRPRPEVVAASVGVLSAVAVVLVLATWWRRR